MNISGFSDESLASVEQLLYGENIDWKKSFKTGKGPGPENPANYRTGQTKAQGPGNWKIGKANNHRNHRQKKEESGMISPLAYPKQKANWDPPPTDEVNGMRMLG